MYECMNLRLAITTYVLLQLYTQHHWRYGDNSNRVLQEIGLSIGGKEKAAMLPMHQMAEVPIELLNPQSCVSEGAAIGDFNQPLAPYSWPSLSLKSELLTSPMYSLTIFYY